MKAPRRGPTSADQHTTGDRSGREQSRPRTEQDANRAGREQSWPRTHPASTRTEPLFILRRPTRSPTLFRPPQNQPSSTPPRAFLRFPWTCNLKTRGTRRLWCASAPQRPERAAPLPVYRYVHESPITPKCPSTIPSPPPRNSQTTAPNTRPKPLHRASSTLPLSLQCAHPSPRASRDRTTKPQTCNAISRHARKQLATTLGALPPRMPRATRAFRIAPRARLTRAVATHARKSS